MMTKPQYEAWQMEIAILANAPQTDEVKNRIHALRNVFIKKAFRKYSEVK